LECGETIRQKRQFTREMEDGEKTRIIYFCPKCQNTTVELKPLKKR
jgi:endonuclease VIII